MPAAAIEATPQTARTVLACVAFAFRRTLSARSAEAIAIETKSSRYCLLARSEFDSKQSAGMLCCRSDGGDRSVVRMPLPVPRVRFTSPGSSSASSRMICATASTGGWAKSSGSERVIYLTPNDLLGGVNVLPLALNSRRILRRDSGRNGRTTSNHVSWRAAISEVSCFDQLATGSNPLRMKCDAEQLIVNIRKALLAEIMQAAAWA